MISEIVSDCRTDLNGVIARFEQIDKAQFSEVATIYREALTVYLIAKKMFLTLSHENNEKIDAFLLRNNIVIPEVDQLEPHKSIITSLLMDVCTFACRLEEVGNTFRSDEEPSLLSKFIEELQR